MNIYSKRVLITSPSLNVKDNVSGISSLVADIINYSDYDFVHFQLGSKDTLKKKNLRWFFDQVMVYAKIFYTSVFKKYAIVHLNVGLETFSIIRDGLIFFIVQKIFRKKVVLHVHGGYYLMHEPKGRVLNFFLDNMFRNAQRIIVLSDLEQEILEARYGKLPFYVFPNAVDTKSINGFKKEPPTAEIRFVFMGRINRTKGIYTITKSLSALSAYYDRFSLRIFGNGPDLNEWQEELAQLKGLQYSFEGVVGGDAKWEALCSSDVFLLPSLHSEGMPIAMIEAMAAGCVVIVTDVASIKAVVCDNENGILLSEHSAEELAKQMEDIILGKTDMKRLGDNAKLFVENNLSLPTYINKLENLYTCL
jgi:glycosyltransferase involved in cell wall biosynthesis